MPEEIKSNDLKGSKGEDGRAGSPALAPVVALNVMCLSTLIQGCPARTTPTVFAGWFAFYAAP